MSSEGLDHWRRFEPWLAPLKQALGPALDTLNEMVANPAQHDTFDFAFIDADKTGYVAYYECMLRLLRSGGLRDRRRKVPSDQHGRDQRDAAQRLESLDDRPHARWGRLHRVIDGAMGARFLQTLRSFLEEPMMMIA